MFLFELKTYCIQKIRTLRRDVEAFVNLKPQLQLTCPGSELIFYQRKRVETTCPLGLVFFIQLSLSHLKQLSHPEMAEDLRRRVESTRRGFEVRRLHKHFPARFWWRGKNRTTAKGGLTSLLIWLDILLVVISLTCFLLFSTFRNVEQGQYFAWISYLREVGFSISLA